MDDVDFMLLEYIMISIRNKIILLILFFFDYELLKFS